MAKFVTALIIGDVISWIIFAISDSGIAGTLGMFFLVLLLAILSGWLGVEPDRTASRQRAELNAARVNEYQIKNLYNSITSDKK